MNILGAGMAGLLAAHYFRDMKPVIYERQPSLPQNHHALFRLRSDAIGRITGVPLRKVRVHKGVLDDDAVMHSTTNLRHANAYSYKVLGKVLPRSVLNLDSVDRWVPEKPETFLADLAAGLDIRYGYQAKWQDLWSESTLSTLPLPFWWERIDFPKYQFNATPINVMTVTLPPEKVDVYQTVYVPFQMAQNDDWFMDGVYRVSVTGNVMIIEMTKQSVTPKTTAAQCMITMFGTFFEPTSIVQNVQPRGKIAPIDDTLRKRAIIKLTDECNIISFGRFATWRNLVMDDLVNDLEVIRRLMGNPYARRLHYADKRE